MRRSDAALRGVRRLEWDYIGAWEGLYSAITQARCYYESQQSPVK